MKPQPPLVRFLSRCNVASRPEARRLVQAGRVQVNGRVCFQGERRIDGDRDEVRVDGTRVRLPRPDELEWWIANKPRGLVSTTKDPEGRTTVMSLIPVPHAPGLAPVGRLDKASAGLLLFTNDTVMAARLLDPAGHVEKRYRVKIRGHPTEQTLRAWRGEARMVEGLELGPMRVTVEREGPKSAWLRIGLREGKNRQIRRRLEADGHGVEVLIRIAFGPLSLGDMAPGAARRLTPAEVERLGSGVA